MDIVETFFLLLDFKKNSLEKGVSLFVVVVVIVVVVGIVVLVGVRNLGDRDRGKV